MPDALLPTLIVTALILVNGLFVAAEFAIVGAPAQGIARRAATGDRRARLVARILADPRELDRFIATAQLGITLASLGLGMYGEHILAGWLAGLFESWGAGRWIAAHTLASIAAISILTYFHIVVGEMVPKSLALQRAEHTVLWIAPVLRVLQVAAFPFVFALDWIGDAVLRLLGIRRDVRNAEHYRTAAELAYLVDEAQRGGLLRRGPARVVSELLDFGELTAGEVMVPRVRVVAIPLGASPDDVTDVLLTRPFTRYPVVDGTVDRIVGMVHVKDILAWQPTGTPLDADRLRAVPYVPTTASVDQVMAAMRGADTQMVVVLDEHGGTAGVLTVEDLFEEVVGAVGDDVAGAPEVRPGGGGSVLVDGAARLETLGDALGLELSHPDVDTVSGLVLALLGRPPRLGDVVAYGGVRIEVTAVEGHGVGEARARPEGADPPVT